MHIGSKIYGKGFKGNRVETLSRGKGFVTGTVRGGRRFLFRTADLSSITVR